jgi:hypothetical protein
MLHIFHNVNLTSLVLGLILILQPWWHGGLRVGFFVTLVATIGYIVTSHLEPSSKS